MFVYIVEVCVHVALKTLLFLKAHTNRQMSCKFYLWITNSDNDVMQMSKGYSRVQKVLLAAILGGVSRDCQYLLIDVHNPC